MAIQSICPQPAPLNPAPPLDLVGPCTLDRTDHQGMSDSLSVV